MSLRHSLLASTMAVTLVAGFGSYKPSPDAYGSVVAKVNGPRKCNVEETIVTFKANMSRLLRGRLPALRKYVPRNKDAILTVTVDVDYAGKVKKISGTIAWTRGRKNLSAKDLGLESMNSKIVTPQGGSCFFELVRQMPAES